MNDVLIALAVLAFAAASIYAFVKKSVVAGLVCAGVVFLVLDGTGLIHG